MTLSPMPTRVVSSNGVDIATYVRGEGKTVVMINGLGASAQDWGPVAERLAERARVITFDNRGAGRSVAPDEPFTLELMADDVAAIYEAYGLTSSYLVGYSMGGMIAQIFVARHSALVEKLVLLATHAGMQSAVPPTPEIQKMLYAPPGNRSREEIVRQHYAALVEPGFLQHHREIFERMMTVRLANLIPLYALLHQTVALRSSERADLVRNIRIPTLIAHGTYDPLIPFANGEMLHDMIAGSRFVKLEDCGHMVNWEKTDEVVAAITEFLNL